jgi:hypothetical protein
VITVQGTPAGLGDLISAPNLIKTLREGFLEEVISGLKPEELGGWGEMFPARCTGERSSLDLKRCKGQQQPAWERRRWPGVSRDDFFLFFEVQGLELRAYTLSPSTSPFFVKYFLR